MDTRLRAIIQPELVSGERLVWAGRPNRLRLADEGWRREPMGRPRARGSRQGPRGKVENLVWGGGAIYASS